MTRMIGRRAAAVCVAAVALTLPAAASAKVVTFGGAFAAEGKIAIDVVVGKKGKPKGIAEIRVVDVPVRCETSGPLAVWAELPSPGLEVRKGSFTYKSKQPRYGNVKRVTGDFAKRGKLIRGELAYSHRFPAEDGLPEEDCRSRGKLSFSAERGGDDVQTPPERVASARRG